MDMLSIFYRLLRPQGRNWVFLREAQVFIIRIIIYIALAQVPNVLRFC